jgi:nitrogen fixation/metabolism regulation signal transduction histidine kinase
VRYTDLFDARSSGDARRAEDVLADLAAEERAVDSELRGARRLLQERIEIVSSTAAEQERQAAILLMALTALALLVGVVVLWLAYRMLSPLPRLQRRVAVVARGDLSPAATLRSNDELGRLSEAFEEMVAALATRDVRLREAAEAELRLKRVQEQIVANLSAAVLVVDADGVVRTANPAAHRVLGLPRDAVGGRLDALGLLSKLPALRDAMERVDAGAERAVLEAVSVGPSTDQSVNVLVTPFVPDDPSEARGALVVAEDVTEELRTKARLIHTERLAAIGRMAAHVTHEVRNPLSSIGLNVEMLEDEVGNSPESKALLRAIQREIDRLTSITEEYLRLARLPQPRLEPESIGELVASVASFVAREMEGSGVELRVEVEEGLPAVALDEAQVRQAFLNLLRNARESMPGGGSVEVSATRAAGGVAVCVRDHGAGIDPAVREHIFDLFYTTKERGTGLGLPLTQQIVVAHGGTIECVGEPEGGTTFHLWFPQASEARSPGQGESIGGSVHEDLILDAE